MKNILIVLAIMFFIMVILGGLLSSAMGWSFEKGVLLVVMLDYLYTRTIMALKMSRIQDTSFAHSRAIYMMVTGNDPGKAEYDGQGEGE